MWGYYFSNAEAEIQSTSCQHEGVDFKPHTLQVSNLELELLVFLLKIGGSLPIPPPIKT